MQQEITFISSITVVPLISVTNLLKLAMTVGSASSNSLIYALD